MTKPIDCATVCRRLGTFVLALVSSFTLGLGCGVEEDGALAQSGSPSLAALALTSVEAGASGAEIRMDRLFYRSGQAISTRLRAYEGSWVATKLPILLVSPNTGDLEYQVLGAVQAGVAYASTAPTPLAVGKVGVPVKLDGVLSAKPGEMIFALYYPDYKTETKLAGDATFLYDFAIIEGDPGAPAAPAVLAELAMTPDETVVPPGGKPIGTILEEGGVPVQVPVNELIYVPRKPGELQRFLTETGGHVAATNPLAGETGATPTSYLVKVNPATGDVAHLPAMQAAMGPAKRLYGSNPAVLGLIARAMQLRLEGYAVAPNPRLQPMAAPSVTEGVYTPYAPSPMGDMFTDTAFSVHKAWTFTALWDFDETRVNVAFLDQGFAPNWDYAGYPSDIPQCDMQGADEIDGVLRGFTCGPGVAVSPPTIPIAGWHGNLTVSVAGAVLNNRYGVSGVAGQVMQPMLYRFGWTSYAFEMGLGIRHAVDQGASAVNISWGYPCRIFTNIGLDWEICTGIGRASFCGQLTAALVAAAAVVCASSSVLLGIPFYGPIMVAAVCTGAATAAGAISAACFASALAGDIRAGMADGVDYAHQRGVPVMSAAGNLLAPDVPAEVRALIDFSVTDPGVLGLIPCTIDPVICVGGTAATAPYANLDFAGLSVDIWAPEEGACFTRPPTPETVVPPESQTLNLIAGSAPAVCEMGRTSAATAYVSGVVALIQAAQPDLDPQRTGRSDAARAAIPDDLRRLLRTSGAAMPSLAPWDGRLVNPRAAVWQATPAAILRYLLVLAYDTWLDHNEDTGRFDTEATAYTLCAGAGCTTTGTVHALPGGRPGWRSSMDTDWYAIRMPAAAGIYQALLDIRTPSTYGTPFIEGPGLRLVSRSTDAPTGEDIATFRTPRLFGSAVARLRLAASPDSRADNVYKIHVYAAEWLDAPPLVGDRFDRDVPTVNPPESWPANDDRGHAVELGGTRTDDFAVELGWREVVGSPQPASEIPLPELSFHTAVDQDWFRIEAPPPAWADPSGCPPGITVDAGVDVYVTAMVAGEIVTEGPSPVTIFSGILDLPLEVVLRARIMGAPVDYDLSFRYGAPLGWVCNLPDEVYGRPAEIWWVDPGPYQLPRVLPSYSSLRGTPWETRVMRELDAAGLLVTPDLYVVDWKGGSFQAFAEVTDGTSLALGLAGPDGKPLAAATTPDLAQTPDPRLSAGQLWLQAGVLSEGRYALTVSHSRPTTRFLLYLPRSVTRSGVVAVEDRLGIQK